VSVAVRVSRHARRRARERLDLPEGEDAAAVLLGAIAEGGVRAAGDALAVKASLDGRAFDVILRSGAPGNEALLVASTVIPRGRRHGRAGE